MKSQQQIIPIQCARCGGKFDLWQELLKNREDTVYELASNQVEDYEHLCSYCREKEKEERETEKLELADEDINSLIEDDNNMEVVWE